MISKEEVDRRVAESRGKAKDLKAFRARWMRLEDEFQAHAVRIMTAVKEDNDELFLAEQSKMQRLEAEVDRVRSEADTYYRPTNESWWKDYESLGQDLLEHQAEQHLIRIRARRGH